MFVRDVTVSISQSRISAEGKNQTKHDKHSLSTICFLSFLCYSFPSSPVFSSLLFLGLCSLFQSFLSFSLFLFSHGLTFIISSSGQALLDVTVIQWSTIDSSQKYTHTHIHTNYFTYTPPHLPQPSHLFLHFYYFSSLPSLFSPLLLCRLLACPTLSF